MWVTHPVSSYRLLIGGLMVGVALWLGDVPACGQAPSKTPAQTAATTPSHGSPDASAASTFPVRIRFEPVPLDRADPTRHRLGELHYLAGYHLTADRSEFGGLSGLACLGTTSLLAISDRGHWLSVQLAFDETGRLRRLHDGVMGPLLDTDGQPVAGRARRDAEELSPAPQGGFLVAFEGDHRVVAYDNSGPRALAEQPRVVSSPAGIARTGDNTGFEAVTLLADGRLLLLTEGLRDDSGKLVGWMGSVAAASTADAPTDDDAESAPWSYRDVRVEPMGPHQPTAATTLPPGGPMAGDVLYLQRFYSPATGTLVRLARLDEADLPNAADPPSDTVLQGHELAHFQGSITVDNFEGLTACSRAGRTFIYLVSDDNFSATQRTLLLQFELRPPGE